MIGYFNRGTKLLGFAGLVFVSTQAFAGMKSGPRQLESIRGLSCQMIFSDRTARVTTAISESERYIAQTKAQIELPNRQRDEKDPRFLAFLRRSKNNPVTQQLAYQLKNAEERIENQRRQEALLGEVLELTHLAEALPSFGSLDRYVQDWAQRSAHSLSYLLLDERTKFRTPEIAKLTQTFRERLTELKSLSSHGDQQNLGLVLLLAKYEIADLQPVLDAARSEIMKSSGRYALSEKTVNILVGSYAETLIGNAAEIHGTFRAIQGRLASPSSDRTGRGLYLDSKDIAQLARIAIRYRSGRRYGVPDPSYALVEHYRKIEDNFLSLTPHPRTKEIPQVKTVTALTRVALNNPETSTETILQNFRKLRLLSFARAEKAQRILSDEAIAELTEATLGENALSPLQALGLYDFHEASAHSSTTDVTIAQLAVLGRKYQRTPDQMVHLDELFLAMIQHIPNADSIHLMRVALEWADSRRYELTDDKAYSVVFGVYVGWRL